jgi:hypothetical protein
LVMPEGVNPVLVLNAEVATRIIDQKLFPVVLRISYRFVDSPLVASTVNHRSHVDCLKKNYLVEA